MQRERSDSVLSPLPEYRERVQWASSPSKRHPSHFAEADYAVSIAPVRRADLAAGPALDEVGAAAVAGVAVARVKTRWRDRRQLAIDVVMRAEQVAERAVQRDRQFACAGFDRAGDVNFERMGNKMAEHTR